MELDGNRWKIFNHGCTRMNTDRENCRRERRTSNAERRTSTDRNSGALPRRRYNWLHSPFHQGKVLAHRGFEEKLTVMFSAKPEERGFSAQSICCERLARNAKWFRTSRVRTKWCRCIFLTTDGEIAEGNIEHRTLNAERRRIEIAALCRGAATTVPGSIFLLRFLVSLWVIAVKCDPRCNLK
jgi:hypothetical protein